MNLLEDILNKRSKIDTAVWNEIHIFLYEEGISDDDMQLSLSLQKVIQCAKLTQMDRLDESSLLRRDIIESYKISITKCDLIIMDPFFYSTFNCNVEKAKRLKETFTDQLKSIKKSRGSAKKTIVGVLTPVMIKFRIAGKNQTERVDIIYRLLKDHNTLHSLNITGDDIEFDAKERIRKWDSKIMEEPDKLVRKYKI